MCRVSNKPCVSGQDGNLLHMASPHGPGHQKGVGWNRSRRVGLCSGTDRAGADERGMAGLGAEIAEGRRLFQIDRVCLCRLCEGSPLPASDEIRKEDHRRRPDLALPAARQPAAAGW